MEAIRELPFAMAFGILFVIVMLRANATYWLGRAADSGGRKSRRLQNRLEGKSMYRARDIMATWGVAAVPLSFLTIGLQTAINFSAGAMRMPVRNHLGDHLRHCRDRTFHCDLERNQRLALINTTCRL